MMKKTLKDLFVNFCDKGIDRQREDGSMPAGHNGPYYDAETPIRNTSHWSISFARAWQLTNDDRYKQASLDCLEHVFYNTEHRSAHSFLMRTNEKKDKSNGLIGPAWVIEALVNGSRVFNDPKYRDLAEKLFLIHPFDQNLKLWKRCEPNGDTLSIDFTFNHQLWFCAAGTMLGRKNPAICDNVSTFLKNLNTHFGSWEQGRIAHPCWFFKTRVKEFIKRSLKKDYRKTLRIKEIGYHTFNLYAFATISKELNGLFPFDQANLRKTLEYAFSKKYENEIESSPYGYPYNPPGFELPYIAEYLSPNDSSKNQLFIEKQLESTLDPENWVLNRNNEDSETLTARIYEIANCNDELFDLRLNLRDQSRCELSK